MASGYDNRQATRNTFAFKPADPVQVRPSAQGSFRGADVAGGRSTGGYEMAPASAPSGATELGEYFETLMQPHIERKQKEQFIRGVTDQMSRQAGDEIKSSNGLFSKIFGPSAYEEGAIFFAAKKASTDFATSVMEDDSLAQLPPEELSKVIADRMEAAKTGDPLTDQAAQAAMLEAIGPALVAVGKKRYAFGQTVARQNHEASVASAADAHEAFRRSNAALSADGDPDGSIAMADANFLSSLQKPFGMDEDTWHKTLKGEFARVTREGKLHTATAFLNSGFMDTLDDDERAAAQAAYDAASNRRNNEVLGEPDLADRHTRLLARIGLAEYGRGEKPGDPPISVMEARAELRSIGAEVLRRSGASKEPFDYEALLSISKSVISANVSALGRAENRRWQLEDQAATAEAAANEAQQRAQIAYSTWTTGQVIQGRLRGAKDEDYDQLAYKDYAARNYDRIVRGYTDGKYTSPSVSKAMQTFAEAGISAGQYTKGVGDAYNQWKEVNQRSAAAARSYYGEALNLQLSTFHGLVTGGIPPNEAYSKAFQNPAQYSPLMMPAARRKEAQAVIDKLVTEEEESRLRGPWRRTPLNRASQLALKDMLWRGSAALAQNSSEDTAALGRQTRQVIVTNGHYERYGQFAIRNKPGTMPLWQWLKIPQGAVKDADQIIVGVIDAKLRKSGYANGASGEDYWVERQNDDKGRPRLIVHGYDGDEASAWRTVIIGFDELIAATNKHMQDKQSTAPTRIGQTPVVANVPTFMKGTGKVPNRRGPRRRRDGSIIQE